jgi:putative membrane protein
VRDRDRDRARRLMIKLLVSLVLHLAGNAVALVVAAAVLDDMSLDWSAFLIAVAIFTAVEVLAEPLLTKIALNNLHALRGSVALIATFVGLVVTDVVSEGLSISGAWTWVLATIIVWLGALLAGLLLPVIFVKRRVQDDRRLTIRSA